jgi:neutral trehalase
MQQRTSDIAAGIKFGYSPNQAGFGWTNAAVLELLAGMGTGGSPKAPSGDLVEAIRR